MQTQTITYPSLPRCVTHTVPTIQYNKQQTSNEMPSLKKSPTYEFELITPSSLSSSISIVNSIVDDFTPLPSPLYSTAIAYSPTTDIL